MKNRIGVIILALVAIGFGIALIVVEKQATEREAQDAKTIGTYSNKWVSTSAKLDEQTQVSAINEKKLESQQKLLEQLTNGVAETLANLAQVSANLTQAETSLKASQEEVAKRDARIADLENQNHALDTQALELSNAITNLTMEIADTRKKLAGSEGDKNYLEGQLKRLLAEKSELERQFNDISVLRAQVRKLRDEIIIARRIEWTRQGVYARSEQKGAQRLMQGAAASQPKPPKTNYDLNAEINAQGGARIVPPQTNSIPGTNAPSKMTEPHLLVDSHGRILRDLRVSLTDRCNFRCLYCLPETEAAHNFYRGRWANLPGSAPILQQWVPKNQILTFEEIERLVRIAIGLGIQKIRLTGGEPLLRHNLEQLVARIAPIPGLADLAMTTNGFLFPQKAAALRAAGLQRVSFSLDSLDPANFRKITGRDGLARVLESIRMAQDLGFEPVKVNAVIIRDLNDHEIGPLAGFARENNLSLRFIEFMPLDSARAWLREMVVSGREILERVKAHFELLPMANDNPSSTAKRWSFADGRGEIGIIAPVSEPFCGHCNRIRLTADGKIRTCLFSVVEHDVLARLRNGAADAEMAEWLRMIATRKEARHHIGEKDFVAPNRSMSCIGG